LANLQIMQLFLGDKDKQKCMISSKILVSTQGWTKAYWWGFSLVSGVVVERAVARWSLNWRVPLKLKSDSFWFTSLFMLLTGSLWGLVGGVAYLPVGLLHWLQQKGTDSKSTISHLLILRHSSRGAAAHRNCIQLLLFLWVYHMSCICDLPLGIAKYEGDHSCSGPCEMIHWSQNKYISTRLVRSVTGVIGSIMVTLEQPCPTEIPYWDKNYVTVFMRAEH